MRTGKTFSEHIPVVIYFFATVEGSIWTVGSDGNAKFFPSSAVGVSEWYREELVVRKGVF